MAALIELLDAGPATSIQDGGRRGYRRLGVPVSGALDALWLACANALVGNRADAAALECRLRGPRLRVCRGPLRLALASEANATLERADGRRELAAPWRSHTLAVGDTLRVGPLGGAIAYLALSGGIDNEAMLGSRSTYPPAALGGIDGRLLQAGDTLACALAPAGPDLAQSRALRHDAMPLRLIAGPQADHFSDATVAALSGSEFLVSREADRMGIRLDGPRLSYHASFGGDMVSDAVVPGAIQVPADGRAIVLLADCQTVGGYPKIATVITADLPRLGHLMPGERLRFSLVGPAEASAALRRHTLRLASWISDIRHLTPSGMLDEALLYSANLVSGMVSAMAESAGTDVEGAIPDEPTV